MPKEGKNDPQFILFRIHFCLGHVHIGWHGQYLGNVAIKRKGDANICPLSIAEKNKVRYNIFLVSDKIIVAMVKKGKKTKGYEKVINEVYPLSEKRGGGIIKIEAWEDTNGKIAKYSMAYINHFLYSDDNGRVLGYDNAHSYHHKHYFGEIISVEDFKGYQELVERFKNEMKEFIK